MMEPNEQPHSLGIERWEEAATEYSEFVETDIFRKQLADPVVFGWFGNVSGKYILDAGCGEGYLSRTLAAKGATVTGIDGAKNLVDIAKKRNNGGKNPTFAVHDLRTRLPFANGTFDAVACHLALMDFDPIETAVNEWARVLRAQGTLVISILHPAFDVAPLHKTVAERILHRPPHFAVKKYHAPERITRTWHGKNIKTMIYHRPISYYVRTLHDSGFTLQEMQEPVFSKEFVKGKNNFIKLSSEVPPFLLLRATKGVQ